MDAQIIARFDAWIEPDTNGGCWLWAGARDSGGYGVFQAQDKRLIKAHRFQWLARRGSIPAGLFVLHRCDVRACANPAHLFLGTIKDNVEDMIRKGRKFPNQGAAAGGAKLTEQKVVDIRHARAAGASLASLADHYRVSEATVRKVCNRERWAHVGDRPAPVAGRNGQVAA